MQDAKSAWSRHTPRRCPRLLRSWPALRTPPALSAPGVLVAHPAPRGWRFAPDPSGRAPASDSPNSRRLPAARIPPLSAAALIPLDIHPASAPPLHHRGSDAASAGSRAASQLAPYRTRGSPASHEIPPSVWLRATSDLLPVALVRSSPGSCDSVFSALTWLHQSTAPWLRAAKNPACPSLPASPRKIPARPHR